MALPLSTLDWIALAWFFAWWIGYIFFAQWHSKHRPSLVGQMTHYRKLWMMRVTGRDLPIADVSILANLSNGSTFFASTTLLILGGLLALLGTTDQLASVVAELPFTREGPQKMWDIKILLLTAVFIFAFFKFTWSLRLFHFCSVLIGGVPSPDDERPHDETFVRRAAETATLAAESFNNGLRSYYFGLAALTWFLNPWAWMIATSWIVLILYHREFHSSALKALTRD